MELYGCGFNALNQLSAFTELTTSDKPADVLEFKHLATGDEVDVLWCGWSELVTKTDKTLYLHGTKANPHRRRLSIPISNSADPSATPSTFFGTHAGVQGFLTPSGQAHILEQTYDPVSPLDHLPLSPDLSEYPKLSDIAITSSNKVAIVLQQEPTATSSHINEFSTLDDFKSWYCNPTSLKSPKPKQFEISGKAKTLKAGANWFVALTVSGDVYTWGDARHARALGRTCEDNLDAEKPGIVDAVGGVGIAKVAAGGWMGAALSEGGDGYVWGMKRPGGSGRVVKALVEEEEDDDLDVRLIDLPDPGGNGEPVDIRDLDVGNGHIAVATMDNRLFVCGEARNGQLGVGARIGEFVEDWTQVDLSDSGMDGREIVRVICGDKNTFIVAKR